MCSKDPSLPARSPLGTEHTSAVPKGRPVNSNGFQPVAIHHNDQFGDKTHAREAFDPYPPEAFISTTLVHNVLGYYTQGAT